MSGNGGVMLPAVKDVIALIAKHNLVLATGHSSADEGREFVGSSRETPDSPARVGRFVDAIRKIGPEFCILPADGYAAFLAAMRARGFSQADVDRMSKRNPAVLLGLP